MDPSFNPAEENTYEFLDRFFGEMAGLFTDSYIHIGGDENKGVHWNANPEIQKFMQDNNIADNHELQGYFNSRILEILQKYGRKMVGWDEILQPGLPRDIVIQSWRGREALEDAARKAYYAILSNGYYIDLIQPASFHYANDPIPPDSPLTEEEKQFILGGEATMWSEYVTPETVDSRIWPRTAAIAERFWSPGSINYTDDMYQRLDIVSFRLDELGLKHNTNYEMMLRRLTGGEDIKALKTLVDVIEPVKGYRRGRLDEYFSYSPLTRVVDAARPESKTARDFERMVRLFLEGAQQDGETYEQVRKHLLTWKSNHSALLPVIVRSPVLREIEPLSEDLTAVSDIGLDALDLVNNGRRASDEWLQINRIILEKAAAPRGAVELMILPAVERLVNATQ